MCDAIYICNTQQTFKKIMNGHFSDLQCLLKNGQKPDSFYDHLVQHFNSTMSRTDLRKCITFKVIKQLNPIDAMKIFKKPNCNLCMQERLTILKSYVTNSSRYWTRIWRFMGPAGTKRLSGDFDWALMIPFWTGERVGPLKDFSNIMTWNRQQLLWILETFLSKQLRKN